MTDCSVAGCEKPAKSRGWCTGHYERWRRTGDVMADVPLLREDYVAVHARLRRARGKASAHPCIAPDCTEQATQWAWQWRGPARSGFTPEGAAVTWGLDLDTYAPMCARHARLMDGGGTLTHCRHGHERGGRADGQCVECRRIKEQKRPPRNRTGGVIPPFITDRIPGHEDDQPGADHENGST